MGGRDASRGVGNGNGPGAARRAREMAAARPARGGDSSGDGASPLSLRLILEKKKNKIYLINSDLNVI